MERNDGTPEKPYFMSRGLQKIVGKMQKFNVQKEEHRLEQVRRREHQKKYGTWILVIMLIRNDQLNLFTNVTLFVDFNLFYYESY